MKYLIAKIVETEGSLVIEKLDKGLLEMRNTPNENGLSAAQMVFGQDLRSVLPSIRASLLKEKKKNYYNLHSKTLPELCIKQQVRVQDEETKRWNKIGTIIRIGNHRQYLVEMENGRKLWRNRKFLRLIQQEKIPREVDRNDGFTAQSKPSTPPTAPREVESDAGFHGWRSSTPPRRVTFQEEPNEVVNGQRMMLRRNGGINYRALAGME